MTLMPRWLATSAEPWLMNEPVVMKRGGENAFADCMQTHGSRAFDELVRRQDGYIED